VTRAYLFDHREAGGFPVQRAAVGDCDLSVVHVGGEWQWLIRCAGRDIAEGAARSDDDAQRQAEAAAQQLARRKGPSEWGPGSGRIASVVVLR